MHLIVYVSDYTGLQADINSELAVIVEDAKLRNKILHISGVLFYQNRSFLQIIEGSQRSLQYLMSSIERDARHANLVRLIDQPIVQRGFGDWNMDSFNLADDATLDRDKLQEVSDSFGANPMLKTDLLMQFYKNLI